MPQDYFETYYAPPKESESLIADSLLLSLENLKILSSDFRLEILVSSAQIESTFSRFASWESLSTRFLSWYDFRLFLLKIAFIAYSPNDKMSVDGAIKVLHNLFQVMGLDTLCIDKNTSATSCHNLHCSVCSGSRGSIISLQENRFEKNEVLNFTDIVDFVGLFWFICLFF